MSEKSVIPVSDEQAKAIEDQDVAMEARYIVTGFKNAPTNSALAGVAAHLDRIVGQALTNMGIGVRPDTFSRSLPPPQSKERELEDAREYIPFMTPKERRIIGYLLHHNQRMFECDADGGHAKTLLSQGIVRIAAKRGQVIDYENVPFEIPLRIWKVLAKYRNEFPYEPEENDAYPWRVAWYAR